MTTIKLFPEPAQPTIAIFTAPMSLLIVGYFASSPSETRCSSTPCWPSLRIKFYPTYAAFSFPYVISATAFRLGVTFLAERGVHVLAPLAAVGQWSAVAVILYVSVQYVRFFHWWLKF